MSKKCGLRTGAEFQELYKSVVLRPPRYLRWAVEWFEIWTAHDHIYIGSSRSFDLRTTRKALKTPSKIKVVLFYTKNFLILFKKTLFSTFYIVNWKRIKLTSLYVSRNKLLLYRINRQIKKDKSVPWKCKTD